MQRLMKYAKAVQTQIYIFDKLYSFSVISEALRIETNLKISIINALAAKIIIQ